MSAHHGLRHAHPSLDLLNIKSTCSVLDRFKKHGLIIDKKEKDFIRFFHSSIQTNVLSHCYPEDYRIYLPAREKFIQLYKPQEKFPESNLGIHLRLGDRLLLRERVQFSNRMNLEAFRRAIDSFKCSTISIYTDMPIWRELDIETLSRLRFHKEVHAKDREDLSVAVSFFNKVYRAMESYNPVVRHGQSVKDDFELMRRHQSLLFQHGTLAWWAAFLGHGRRVGLYRHWRHQTFKSLGCLSNTPIPGWFHWE